ncbi:hypothetical protein N9W79_01925 [bacterium]|nr:hypothetical protein [bacterium]
MKKIYSAILVSAFLLSSPLQTSTLASNSYSIELAECSDCGGPVANDGHCTGRGCT